MPTVPSPISPRPSSAGNHDVAGFDLGLVFLRPARPHGALDPGAALKRFERAIHQRAFRNLAHADREDLCGRYSQHQFVLHEVDDEHFELGARDLLLLDPDDLADTVRWIDDELASLK